MASKVNTKKANMEPEKPTHVVVDIPLIYPKAGVKEDGVPYVTKPMFEKMTNEFLASNHAFASLYSGEDYYKIFVEPTTNPESSISPAIKSFIDYGIDFRRIIGHVVGITNETIKVLVANEPNAIESLQSVAAIGKMYFEGMASDPNRIKKGTFPHLVEFIIIPVEIEEMATEPIEIVEGEVID